MGSHDAHRRVRATAGSPFAMESSRSDVQRFLRMRAGADTTVRVQSDRRVHVINGVDGFRLLCDRIVEEPMVDYKLVALGPHDFGGRLDRGSAGLCDWSAPQRIIVIAGTPEGLRVGATEYL